MNVVDIIGQLSDLKHIDYRNTLAISTILELLIDKGLITREEFAHKAAHLENETLAETIMKRRTARY